MTTHNAAIRPEPASLNVRIELPSKATEPTWRPLKVALQLVWAHEVAPIVDNDVMSMTEIGRVMGISPQLVGQRLRLLYLSPRIQEEILNWKVGKGKDPIGRRLCEELAALTSWREQEGGRVHQALSQAAHTDH